MRKIRIIAHSFHAQHVLWRNECTTSITNVCINPQQAWVMLV